MGRVKDWGMREGFLDGPHEDDQLRWDIERICSITGLIPRGMGFADPDTGEPVSLSEAEDLAQEIHSCVRREPIVWSDEGRLYAPGWYWGRDGRIAGPFFCREDAIEHARDHDAY